MPSAAPQTELEAARVELLRRRLVVLAYVVAVVLIGLSVLIQWTLRRAAGPARAISLAPAFGGVMMIGGATFKYFRGREQRMRMTLRDLVRRTSAIVMLAVVMQLPAAHHTALALTRLLRAGGLQHVQIGALVPLFVSLLCVHLAASLVVPWTLWESARPVLGIIGIAALFAPFAPDPWPARFGGIVGLALMGVPGMAVSWLRYSRFRRAFEFSFITRRYREVERELSAARRIHEKVFPVRVAIGPVHFDFRYEPMHQIGGDFVTLMQPQASADAAAAGPPPLTAVLVDVTGHGIAAALAVNRLHGEIKRVLAQRPSAAGASPAQVIAALNDYVHLTLAEEAVFATAIAIQIDPRTNRVTWSSAGHPPAFLCRAADGSIERMDSTSLMLGPLGTEAYDAQQRSADLRDGDTIVAYTDGAIECRDAADRQLGIDGLCALVRAANLQPTGGRPTSPRAALGDVLDAVMSGIVRHRSGAPDDDTLLLGLSITSATHPGMSVMPAVPAASALTA